MTRINDTSNVLLSQRVMNQQNQSLNQSLQRLSTGLRINKGSDDPAGLIASETLRSEKTAISAAIGNAERADQVVNIAEGGLQEISSMLTELQGLVSQSASASGLSDEEKEANQQQIDSLLQSVDRIANTTSFQGSKLLNGSMDFQVTDQDAAVTDYQINGAKLGDEGLDVEASVTQSAQHAGLVMSMDASELALSDAQAQFTFEVAGAEGSREFTFGQSASIDDMTSQINAFKDSTGVSAATSGTAIVLKSTEYGGDQFVSVKVSDDSDQAGGIYNLSATDESAADTSDSTAFSAAAGGVRDEGQDVAGMINGIVARGEGTTLKVDSDALSVDMTLTGTGAATTGTINAMTIEGGGAQFNLGPSVDMNNQVRLGIGNIAARELGSAATGFLDELASGQSGNVIDGDTGKAQDIVNSAVKQVSQLRGRLGSFQKNVVGSTINSLGVAMENISAAESAVRDTDFAEETASMTRSQILQQAANTAFATAKSQPQNVLGLLG
ncbi:MAG: flagellin [Phycisphaeraceae bacterium]